MNPQASKKCSIAHGQTEDGTFVFFVGTELLRRFFEKKKLINKSFNISFQFIYFLFFIIIFFLNNFLYNFCIYLIINRFTKCFLRHSKVYFVY